LTGLQLPTLQLVEADHVGVSEQGDALHLHLPQLLEHESHQLLAQPRPLVGGMDRHIPDRGLQHPITGAAGKAHQLRQAWIVSPEPHPQQAVLKRLAHAAQGPAAPTDGIAEPLEFEQINLPLQAQDELKLRIGRGADPELGAVGTGQEVGGIQTRGARQRNGTILPDPRRAVAGWKATNAEGMPARNTGDPLLICLHGWLLSGQLWHPLLEELAPRWRVEAPDLPGFGQRPRPRGLQPSLASYGRWVAQHSLEQAGNRPIVLVGHSLGGSLALHAAPLLGDHLLGVIQIGVGGGVYQPRAFARLRQGGAALLRFRPGWLAGWPGTASIRSPLIADRRAALGLLACSTSRAAVREIPGLTAALQVPSLWIAGSRDQVMEPRYVRHLAGYSDQHELAVLDGCGHLPMRESPRQLAALIDAWLEKRIAGSGRTRDGQGFPSAQSLTNPRS